MKKNFGNLTESFGFTYLLLPPVILILSGCSWLLGGHIHALFILVAVIISLLLSSKISSGKWFNGQLWMIVGSILLIIGIICYLFNDSAFDSNWYHQPGIYMLSHGWNPIYQHHSIYLGDSTANMWIDHYDKGQETINASIVTLTGNMEIGKLGNFFLPISSIMFCFITLKKYFPNWVESKISLLAFIISFPPIISNQILTNYVDFELYPIILISLCSALIYYNAPIKFNVVFLSLLMMAISVKYNIFMWFGLLYFCIMICFIYQKRKKEVCNILGLGIVGVLISLGTFSFNPYITNTLDYGTPIYPLMGGKKNIDIMSGVEPKLFKKYNFVEKILVADFSRPTTGTQSQQYQFPYGGYKLKNLTACGSADTKLGGSGLFWIDSLLLAIVLFVFSKSYHTKSGKISIILSSLFFATQFVVPGGWFCRYVSYIYLIPILLLLSTESFHKRKWINIVRNFVYGLLFLNNIIAILTTTSTTLIANQIEDYYVKCINATDKPCYQSTLYGFVRKLDPQKRTLQVEDDEKLETIPLLPTRVRIGIAYNVLSRNVKTNFIQKYLLKKGFLK